MNGEVSGEGEDIVYITKVTTETFRQEVLECDLPVVVDFFADWCQPCRQIAPVLNALSQMHEGRVVFTKVNIDEEPELARAYRVSSIPAVLRFDSGVPTAWSLGPKPGYLLEKELRLPSSIRKSQVGGTDQNRRLIGALKSWWRSQ